MSVAGVQSYISAPYIYMVPAQEGLGPMNDWRKQPGELLDGVPINLSTLNKLLREHHISSHFTCVFNSSHMLTLDAMFAHAVKNHVVFWTVWGLVLCMYDVSERGWLYSDCLERIWIVLKTQSRPWWTKCLWCFWQDSLDRIVPEGKMYRHDDEGSDDMPAHVKVCTSNHSLRVVGILEWGSPVCFLLISSKRFTDIYHACMYRTRLSYKKSNMLSNYTTSAPRCETSLNQVYFVCFYL